MSQQITIDFSVHQIENLPENQEILDSNREHFSDQCRRVYELLKSGKRLTTTEALQYGIGDLRARIRDLIKFNNVPIQKRLITGRFKEYFLETDNTGN